ncbi:hypothetical protein M0813_04733 [Anaeramoeba flamelloides]|uniref:Secondary thiamine-phosphate synthase enzyme n=1 Tax=Anaeramoeba flamelloides TaxID=1746091 RepID=A0AAV7ZX69_9EUKA|nr:hypothetical protein M0812_08695 [Anaeramoeba flamelloides]KAJ6232517.1 hypothetical protein M0813_04733 [Anaeramoeba flamelloides]|eukprot:Anaeramoba_flamelloidesa1061897_107.p1 GENE.a1061897_107~~a1061897_107.p1  ORF type:complete len:160 (-),score=29.16 a1061897_107:172-600(-)
MTFKTFTKELTFKTKKRVEIVDITSQVEQAVEDSGIQEGIMLVNPMHITASVMVQDHESGLWKDIIRVLSELVPYDESSETYKHHLSGEDNADSHIKRQLCGRSVSMAITNGKIHAGPWEAIQYFEFDGKRKKRVLIKIIGM